MAIMAAEPIVNSGSDQQVLPPMVHRRSADYQPNTWDYDSICSLHQQHQDKEEEDGGHQNKPSNQNSLQTSLKDRVRQMLLKEEQADLPVRLRLIDQLQSLGVAYHFEEEIKTILVSTAAALQGQAEAGVHHQLKDDLSSTALLFIMLRGHGLPASTDMLSTFRDDNKDCFKAPNLKDVDGLISLYEASYLAFPGETMLDEARAFALEGLKQVMPSMGPHQRERIEGVFLDLPSHWRAPRLQAIWSLKQQQCKNNGNNDDDSLSWIDPSILQLATVDFNLVQAVHRGELQKITRWWKDTGLGEKLPFARDRLVECFFCSVCIAPEPRFTGCREMLAKVSSLIVHLDDIYDIYGTLDELAAFTDAIGRWDDDVDLPADQEALPEYMKAMYLAISTTSVAAADGVMRNQGYHVLPLYKKAWHELCKAFLVEAKWQQEGYMPGIDEYLSNGWLTSTGPLLLLHAFPMLNQNLKQQQQQQVDSWLHNGSIVYPRMVELSSRIFRLCNDCATHKAESERGDAPSSISCYMMEQHASEEEARHAVQDAIAKTWKELNREVSIAGSSAESLMCLNLARIIHCIYHDGDAITSPTDKRKQLVKDMLFRPYVHMPLKSEHQKT